MEENNMFKKNLAMAIMLGLCMATLSTGSAFAMIAEKPATRDEAQSPELDALYARQAEIDKILFEDNVKETEKLGFLVNYTGVVDDYIEVGISPYSDEFANFIYDLVGKDDVKVIEMDQSIMYASGVATGTATSDVVNDAEAATDDQEVQIQIESTSNLDDAVPEPVLYETTAANANDETKKEEGTSTPIVVLAIAGGAALVGGAILVTSKKKSSK